MKICFWLFCSFFFLLISPSLFAQSTITGKIVSLVNKKPVADASVFLSNASVGGKTGEDGAFTLNNVKAGQYDLVVSCIGYETFHQVVLVNNKNITLPEIALFPKVTELKEVKIKYDPDRKKHLKEFMDIFLGTSSNASKCTILNPDIIDLDYSKAKQVLSASTDDFLIIENKALGYRIKYLLKSFSVDEKTNFLSYRGSATFELLEGKPADLKRWQNKRMVAYYGSEMHFLRACIAGKTTEDGFNVLRVIKTLNVERPPDELIGEKLRKFTSLVKVGLSSDSLQYWRERARMPKMLQHIFTANPLKTDAYFRTTVDKGIYAITYPDCLMIEYQKDLDMKSTITFKTPVVFFDDNGIVLNPESNSIEGYWGSLRTADLLPVDYEVPVNVK